MLLAAARRFLSLLVLTATVTAAVSVVFGLLAGASIGRAVSLGFYVVGSFLLVGGFFIGNRGPVRFKKEPEGGIPILGVFGARTVRWATPEEREETINTSAIFVALGLALIVLGVLADTRYRLI